MLSFHSDPAVKEKYVTRLKAHAKADELIKGKYWENGKGCAVGCTIHSSDHAAYQTELGIPEWLAKLEDAIFEGLDNGAAKTFAVDFLIAIPVGIDLEPVKWKFCAFVLKENIERVLSLDIDEKLKQQVIGAIKNCLALHEDAIRTGQWNESAARSAAESAAQSAARSAAESATRSAAWSAWSSARSAESAAWSAARSAQSAAWSSAESAVWSSAESAAWCAAWSEAFQRYADQLLRLLAESK